MAEVLEGVEAKTIGEALGYLQRDYDEAGGSIQVVEIAGGFQMVTRPQFASWLHRFHHNRRRERLSPAGMETLSIVAYRQPITRAEVEAIRGVDVVGVLKTLLEKRLIRVMGRKSVVGKPLIYGTTDQFLRYFGLRNLAELPRLEELKAPAEDQNFTTEVTEGTENTDDRE